MKKLSSILFALIFFTQSLGLSALSESDRQLIGSYNLISNGGFENNKSAWTAASNTFTIDTTNFLAGKGSGLMTMSSQTGTLTNTVTPTVQTASQNMEASCQVKTTLTTIQVCAMSGGTESGCSTVPSTGTWAPVSVNFVGPSNGTSVGVRVKSTGSATGTVNVDDCYVGRARNIGTVAQATLYGAVVVTGCSSLWSTATGSFANFGAVTGCTYSTIGNAQAPSTNIPGIKFAALPPGEYVLQYEGLIGTGTLSTSEELDFRFSDGTNVSREVSKIQTYNSSSPARMPGISQSINYTSAQSNVTLQIQGMNTSGGSTTAVVDGGSRGPGVIRVYYYPPASQQVAALNSGPFFTTPVAWTPVFTGLGTVTNINFVSWRFASHLFIQGTWTNGTTTATEARISLGYNGTDGNVTTASTLPTLSVAGHYNGGTATTTYFGAGAVTMEASKAYITLSNEASTNSLTKSNGNNLTSSTTYSLFAMVPISGWLAPNLPVPIVIGGLSSNSVGAERIERATVTNSGSACSASGTQSGTWISSATRNALGDCSLTLVTGMFSAAPICTCNHFNESANYYDTCNIRSTSTTEVRVVIGNSAAAANRDDPFSIICMGPR